MRERLDSVSWTAAYFLLAAAAGALAEPFFVGLFGFLGLEPETWAPAFMTHAWAWIGPSLPYLAFGLGGVGVGILIGRFIPRSPKFERDGGDTSLTTLIDDVRFLKMYAGDSREKLTFGVVIDRVNRQRGRFHDQPKVDELVRMLVHVSSLTEKNPALLLEKSDAKAFHLICDGLVRTVEAEESERESIATDVMREASAIFAFSDRPKLETLGAEVFSNLKDEAGA